MSVVDDSFGNPLKIEEQSSAPLAGGVMNRGFQCGMLWGAALAAGAEVYRQFGAGPRAESVSINVTDQLLKTFQMRTKNEMNCTSITEINFQDMSGFMPVLRFIVKGGKIGPGACFRLAGGYARDAFNTIATSLPEEPVEASFQSVSCAALLAGKMDKPEMHQVMVSGFAGGIGLSGGACGVLGAAIWLAAMDNQEEEASKLGYFNNPVYMAVVDKFLAVTDNQFECRNIVGREFESIDDHAGFMHDGGCSQIIDALASS